MAYKRKGTHAMKKRKVQEPVTFASLPEKTKKLIGAGCIALVAIIIIVAALSSADLLPRFSGRLRYYNSTLYGVEENDIVVNGGTSSKPKYYKVASFAGTDKYELDEEYSIKSDENVSEWSYVPDDDTTVDRIYVCGVTKSMTDAYDSYLGYALQVDEDGNYTEDNTFLEGETANGMAYKGFVTVPTFDDGKNAYSRYLSCYVDCGKYCALVWIYGTAATEDGFEDVSVYEAYMTEFANLITVE